MSVAGMNQIAESVAANQRARSRRRRGRASSALWYLLLTAIAVITVFPFFWMLSTSLKGPLDPITSVPPQFLPGNPTLANYEKVLASLPIPRFFFNSVVVSVAVGLLNVLVAALAAYPLAKMRFPGRDAIFYLLLATLIVPAQLTYIPSFVLAVNVFHYYDTLPALIFPNLVSAFNIFLLRQAFRGIPQDLLDAARVDGAGEFRIWRSIAHAARPAVAGRGRDLHVRDVVERLPVAVADAPHSGRHDTPRRSRRAPGLLLVRRPLDRGRRDDDDHPDPDLLHPRPALLRARPGRRRQGVTADRILERVMLAFEGEGVPSWVVKRLAEAPAAGVTLFMAVNVMRLAQVRELTEAVQRAAVAGGAVASAGADGPLLIAADQEGGQLNALGAEATQFAGNMALGAVDDEGLTERVGAAIGREARALGINVIYAPVLDLASEPGNSAMGIRSFGDDPAAVARHGAAMIRGLQSAGVAASVKHFPGLGARGPGHALQARGRAGERRGPRRERARPVPGGDRGGRPARHVGTCRRAGTDRRPDAPRDPVADRHGRHAARRARLPRADHQRRLRHARPGPGSGAGRGGHRRHPRRDRSAPLRAGPARSAPDRGDAPRGCCPRLVRTGRTGGLERATGRPSIAGSRPRARCPTSMSSGPPSTRRSRASSQSER